MYQLVAVRSFVRVAQVLSFQEAARLEGLSQGAISKRVAGLEDHLGVQLLRRNQREVTLTSAGEVYLDRCLELLKEFDIVEASMRADAGIAICRNFATIFSELCLLRAVFDPPFS